MEGMEGMEGVHTYEDEFPRHLAPPDGSDHDATRPTYLLQIDAGVFMAVWEHMEAEARYRFPTRSTYAFTRAYLRSVKAFRKCYWSNHQPPPAPKSVRRLVRRPRKSEGEERAAG